MIEADTRELETKLRQTVIHIRQKEVHLFTDQFAVLASSATFMSSLGFGALNMEIGFLEKEEGEYCSELVGCDGKTPKILLPMALFYVFAAAGTAFNLLTVILASFCMIFGPELAIRGSESSMNHAVKGMYEERHHAIQYFWVGCLFIVLSGISLGWMKFPAPTAGIMTGVFVFLITFCVMYQRQLAPKFKYNSDEGLNQLRSALAAAPQPGGFGGLQQRSTGRPAPPPGGRNTRFASARDLNTSSNYGAINNHGPAGEHSANIFADGTLRYGVFADDTLRLFSLDGKELYSFPSSRRKVHHDHFVLVATADKHREITCYGTTEAETQRWIAALAPDSSKPPA